MRSTDSRMSWNCKAFFTNATIVSEFIGGRNRKKVFSAHVAFLLRPASFLENKVLCYCLQFNQNFKKFVIQFFFKLKMAFFITPRNIVHLNGWNCVRLFIFISNNVCLKQTNFFIDIFHWSLFDSNIQFSMICFN